MPYFCLFKVQFATTRMEFKLDLHVKVSQNESRGYGIKCIFLTLKLKFRIFIHIFCTTIIQNIHNNLGNLAIILLNV